MSIIQSNVLIRRVKAFKLDNELKVKVTIRKQQILKSMPVVISITGISAHLNALDVSP